MGVFYPQIKVVGKVMHLRTGATDESYTENICILPPNAYVMNIYGRVKTAFVGLTNPQVSVGVAGDTNRYMMAQAIDRVKELMPGPSPSTSTQILGLKKFCVKMDREMIYASNIPIIATFTSDSATFAGVTAGEVEFVVVYVDPNVT